MMNSFPDNEMPLDLFLLDELPPAEKESLEIRLLMDDELQIQMAAAEFDLIDDYLRGHLTAAHRTRFEQIFLNSPERRRQLATAQAFWESSLMAGEIPTNEPSKIENFQAFAAGKTPRAPRKWKFPLALAASALFLLSLTFIIYRVFFSTSPAEQGLALLQRAYQNERPLEARVSGFSYAPYTLTLGAPPAVTNQVLREEAASQIRRALIAQPNASNQYALGVYFLQEQKLPEAIEQFTAALKSEPQNARFHSDLGAAWLELARQQKRTATSGYLKNFAQANEHFAQALQQEPQFAPALFNQALCLEQLGLLSQAGETWQKYLQLDSVSEWAKEARRKLAELEAAKKQAVYDPENTARQFIAASQTAQDELSWQLFNSARNGGGNYLTRRFLSEFIELKQAGRHPEAAIRLAWLERMAAREMHLGDSFTHDLLAYYRHATLMQLSLLAQAYQSLLNAQTTFRNDRAGEQAAYAKAKELLLQAGNTQEAAWVDMRISGLLNRMSLQSEAIILNHQVVTYANARSYLRLLFFAQFNLATFARYGRRYSLSLHHNQLAIQLGEKLESPPEQAVGQGQRTLLLLDVGDSEHAAVALEKTQALKPYLKLNKQEEWNKCGEASDVFKATKLFFTAIAYEREGLNAAISINDLARISRSHGFIGEIFGLLNDLPNAYQSVQQAREIGQSMLPDNDRLMALILADRRLGQIAAKRHDWQQALVFFDEGEQLCEKAKSDDLLLEMSQGKLLAYLSLAQPDAARHEVERSLRLFEAASSTVTQESLRNSFFDQGQEIYDLAIQHAAEFEKNHSLAFEYSERSRARSLADLLRTNTSTSNSAKSARMNLTALSRSLTLREVQQALPPKTQIVQYAVLSHVVYIWVVSNTSFQSASVPIEVKNLEAKVVNYLNTLTSLNETQAGQLNVLSQELYQILLQPIVHHLNPDNEICFIPDESLNYLPFGALAAPKGQYLIQQFVIHYAPSATVFLACTSKAAQKTNFLPEHCLSMGNPQFDQTEYPQLKDLPSAVEEAQTVAAYYHAPALVAATATEKALRQQAAQTEIIHLATHGLSNNKLPENSAVLLTPGDDRTDTENDGALRVQEIYQMRFPRTKLVVLSACQTWLGQNYRGEGMVGLARSFLVADAPLVVASLWSVASRPTTMLMKSFHRFRTKENYSTTRALRAAQLTLLQSNDAGMSHPRSWAGFISVGGFASF